MIYDLHVHSNISDGKLTREKIITIAEKNQIEYLSFVEHNDYRKIDYKNSKINFINGIEFDTFYKNSFHSLCYFKTYNSSINALVNKYKENTNTTSDELIKKIKKIHNIEFSLEELQQFFCKSFITKRDIIDWLIYKKYAKNVTEAADKFTSKTAESYVKKYSLDFKEVSDVINNSNGFILLAHPNSLKFNYSELDCFIKELISLGLNGIEVINSSKINLEESQCYKQIAQKYSLLTSGGSDFHDDINYRLGVCGEESNVLIKKLKKINNIII